MSEDKTPQTDQRARGMAADPRLQQRAQTTLTGLLSIIAALFGGLTLIVGILWWLVSKTFGLWPKVFIIVAAVCFIYTIVVNFQAIIAGFRQRRVVTGMNTAVFTVIIVGILVLLNVISVRHRFFRYDATENKQYSLSDQTRKIVTALDKDVEMIAFMSPEYPEYRQTRDRLEEYRALSPRLKVEYYDPHTRVDKVREYNVSVDGSVIIKAAISASCRGCWAPAMTTAAASCGTTASFLLSSARVSIAYCWVSRARLMSFTLSCPSSIGSNSPCPVRK